jgi:hypothetical protein
MKTFILVNPAVRQNAIRAIAEAPDGYEVRIRERSRSLEQNAAMWAALTDISEQVVWHGQKLTPEDWKHVLTAGLKREQRVAPGIGGGFVVLGQSTRKMTKSEFSELLEFCYAFGAEHGVTFELSQSETA